MDPEGEALTGQRPVQVWVSLLVAFDVVFTVACLYLFETVLEAE